MSKPSRREIECLNEIAEREAIAFQRRQSEQFLDCAVNFMMVDFNADYVVRKLRSLAEHIEDHS